MLISVLQASAACKLYHIYMLSREKSTLKNTTVETNASKKKNKQNSRRADKNPACIKMVSYVLFILYKVASFLDTIPSTSCSAVRSFIALSRIKTFLRSNGGNKVQNFCSYSFWQLLCEYQVIKLSANNSSFVG